MNVPLSAGYFSLVGIEHAKCVRLRQFGGRLRILGGIWHISKHFFFCSSGWERSLIVTVVSLSEMKYQSLQCSIP